MRSVHFKRGVLLGVTLFLGGAAFAHEYDRATDRALVVAYSDLDLSQPEQVRTLYRRVHLAARWVCGEPSPRELVLYRKFKACFEDSMTRAVDQLDLPQLTALHQAKAANRPTG